MISKFSHLIMFRSQDLVVPFCKTVHFPLSGNKLHFSSRLCGHVMRTHTPLNFSWLCQCVYLVLSLMCPPRAERVTWEPGIHNATLTCVLWWWDRGKVEQTMDLFVMRHARSVTFFCECACGECTTQTNPAAFVGRHPEVLLLRRWMDGCHTEVKA